MRNVPAVSIKFFYKAGINSNVCNPHYGHGPVGEKTVEIIPRDRGSSHALLLLCSLEGIDTEMMLQTRLLNTYSTGDPAWLVFLQTYSPEFNVAELKQKTT